MFIAIKLVNVSKQYRLGIVGNWTMRDDLEGWWLRVQGKDDPTLKLGELNDRFSFRESNFISALRDINFEVKQSEALGIIGKTEQEKEPFIAITSSYACDFRLFRWQMAW